MSLNRSKNDATPKLAAEISATVDRLRQLSHGQLAELVIRSNLAGLNIELDTKEIDLPVDQFWSEINNRIAFLINNLKSDENFIGKLN